MNYWALIGCAVGGTLLGSFLACVPGLHVFNVAALLLLILDPLRDPTSAHGLAMLLLGMVVGYACLNTVPSVFMAAPDDSTTWMVLPGHRYL
jgi:putative membrane protein